MLWSYFKKDKWIKSWLYKMIQKKFGVKVKAMPRPYTIWNSLGLLTAVAIIRSTENNDIKTWRKYFNYFGKNKWGPAYKLVAGLNTPWQEIEWYKTHRTNHLNIVQQRGPDHKDRPETGSTLCLDYPVLKALEKIWR